MLQWLLAITIALVVGGAGTWLSWGLLRRRDETAAGIAAMSAMSWREFMRILLQALGRRGYHRVSDRGAPATDSDYTLIHEGAHWLLSAKHGSAFVLGRASVNELTAAMALAGAAGGLLVTQGRIDDDARKAAHRQPLELLDGAALWRELRPLLPEPMLGPITEASTRRARQRSLAGWLAALIAGISVFVAVPAPQAHRPLPQPVQSPAIAPPDPAAASGQPPPSTATDAGPPEVQRRELARSVATLPAVTRAVWTSASTLEVFAADTEGDPFLDICPLVERYPALAASRIQLTPPPASGRAVRFRQCRSY